MKWTLIVGSLIVNGVIDTMIYPAAQEHRGRTIINTVIYSCNCKGCTCNFSINAVGDLRDIKVITKSQPLGLITHSLNVAFQVPTMGQQALYSLAISKPYSNEMLDLALVGMPFYVLFVTEKPNDTVLQTHADALGTTKVYRKLDEESLWTEVSTLVHRSKNDFETVFNMQIDPNGDCILWNSNTKKLVINVGKALLN